MADAPVLPSWRYHVSGQARIITTVEELQALEAGQWFESPQEAAEAATAGEAAKAGEAATAGEAESETPHPRSRR